VSVAHFKQDNRNRVGVDNCPNYPLITSQPHIRNISYRD
jgi:hypothetical protein